MNTLRVSKLEVSREARPAGPVPKTLEVFSLQGVSSRRNVKLALERQSKQTVFGS